MHMSFMSKLREAVTQAVEWLNEEADGGTASTAPAIPTRQRQAAVTPERALSLSTVYRGIQIHATAACQLSLAVERGAENCALRMGGDVAPAELDDAIGQSQRRLLPDEGDGHDGLCGFERRDVLRQRIGRLRHRLRPRRPQIPCGSRPRRGRGR